jgi:hypothetical protein
VACFAIRSSQGRTSGINELGNLILGYNAERVPAEFNIRSGSYNLILGDSYNYSSYGGLVAGYGITISGEYASESGGTFNQAIGYAASVSSGGSNAAERRSLPIPYGLYQYVFTMRTFGRRNACAEFGECDDAGGPGNEAPEKIGSAEGL